MYTLQFWKDLLERSLATFAESFVGLAAVNNVSDWLTLDWVQVFILALITTGLAVLKGIASSFKGGVTPTVVSYDYPAVPVVDKP